MSRHKISMVSRLSASMRAFGHTFKLGSSATIPSSAVLNLSGERILTEKDQFQATVFACVDAIVQLATKATPKLMNYSADGEATRDFNHDLVRLLKRPNSRQTWRDLIKWTVGYRETQGNAYWFLAPPISGKKPVEIYVLDPSRVEIKYARGGAAATPVKYTYLVPQVGGRIEFDPDEIVEFPYFSPYSQTVGIGPLQAARLAVDGSLLAQKWQNDTYSKGAMPSGLLTTDQLLDDKTMGLMKDKWRQNYEGTANYGRTVILSGGMHYERLSLSQQDMAFFDGLKFSQQAIMQIFRVPPMLLGQSDTITRANAEASIYAFASQKVQPMMEEIFERINQFILPKFGLDPTQASLEFDSLVPEDKDFELKEDIELLKVGARTINEVRARRNWQAVSWGDEPYTPPTSVSATSDEAEKQPEPQKSLDHDNETHTRTGKHSDKFDHELYQRRVAKAQNQLERKSTPAIQDAYDQAADLIADHVAQNWPTTKAFAAMPMSRNLELRAGVPGELASIADKLRDLIVASLATVISEGVWVSSNLTYRYILGAEGNGMYLENPVAVEWAANHALETATGISQTMQKQAAQIVSAGIANGWNANEVKNKLQDRFANLSDYKAETIAITEIHRAFAYSHFEVAKSLNSETPLAKHWKSTADDRTCDHCAGNDSAGWFPLYAAFPTGHTEPGDGHPRCRCVLQLEPMSDHPELASV